jgi:hypothetical protein
LTAVKHEACGVGALRANRIAVHWGSALAIRTDDAPDTFAIAFELTLARCLRRVTSCVDCNAAPSTSDGSESEYDRRGEEHP